MSHAPRAVLLAIACILLSLGVSAQNVTIPRACSTPETSWFPFCNVSLSYDERVSDLISRLTLEQKPMLLTARESPLGNVSALGLPEYDWGANCVHGVQSFCGSRCPTSFPSPNALGAAFNRTLWQSMAAVIGIELRALWLENAAEYHAGNLPHIGLDCWSPNIGIVRDPRWGRNMETPSEDPLVNGLYGTAYTIGLQNGSDPRYIQAIPTLKHYDANSLEGFWGPYHNITRHNFDAIISMYDLSSTYLPAFRASVQDGGALGLMCSYNAINGVPMCANEFLLTDVLRDKWGYEGYITSDSGAIEDIFSEHHYLPNATETVAAAIKAGCNMESANWPTNHAYATGGLYINYTADAIAAGYMTEADLDEALYWTLMMRFKLGLFDPIEDQPYWHVPPTAVNTPASQSLSLLASQQSIVLLKNDNNTLPLPKGSSIAVIGPHYNAQQALVADYTGQLCMDNTYDCITTVLDAIGSINNASGGATTGVMGCEVTGTSTAGFAEAIAAANAADFVVLMLGLNLTVEDEGLDRHNITLPGMQENLAQAIIALRKPTVVVLINGGIIAIDWIKSNSPAIVEAFYPGFYGSAAIADVLFGDYNPGGKMPVTIYNSSFTEEFDMLNFNMTLAPGRTYRYFTGTPLYPFGWGLSYTTFTLGWASVNPLSNTYLSNAGGNTTTYDVTVTNTGAVAGDEVVMAFFSTDAVPDTDPASLLVRQLFDFQRVSLQPGESTTISFAVDPTTAFMLYDASGDQVSYPGVYTITFTNGVAESQQTTVTVDGEFRIVDTMI